MARDRLTEGRPAEYDRHTLVEYIRANGLEPGSEPEGIENARLPSMPISHRTITLHAEPQAAPERRKRESQPPCRLCGASEYLTLGRHHSWSCPLRGIDVWQEQYRALMGRRRTDMGVVKE